MAGIGCVTEVVRHPTEPKRFSITIMQQSQPLRRMELQASTADAAEYWCRSFAKVIRNDSVEDAEASLFAKALKRRCHRKQERTLLPTLQPQLRRSMSVGVKR